MNITNITIREIKMFDGGKAFYRQNHNSNNFPSFRAKFPIFFLSFKPNQK